MATRARAISNGRPAPALPDEPGLAEVTAVLARLLARLIVHVSSSKTAMPASFRQIIVQELRLGDQADVDVIEAFLVNRPGG